MLPEFILFIRCATEFYDNLHISMTRSKVLQWRTREISRSRQFQIQPWSRVFSNHDFSRSTFDVRFFSSFEKCKNHWQIYKIDNLFLHVDEKNWMIVNNFPLFNRLNIEEIIFETFLQNRRAKNMSIGNYKLVPQIFLTTMWIYKLNSF